jgi:hypothetical protein
MAELELYHITCNAYPIGKVPALEGESFYHLSTQSDVRSWIDKFLDTQNSSEIPLREKAFFACDSIMNCKALKSTVAKPNCTPKIYKVRMKNPSKSPMALVNHLLELGEAHSKNFDVANEYWRPTEDWKFYEYLSMEMEIIEEVPNKDLSQMGQILFWCTNNDGLIADSKLANKIFIK